jgi:hypothetical protein
MLLLAGCASSPSDDTVDNGSGIDGGVQPSNSTELNIQTDDLDSALITRRSLSSDYVLIGEVSQPETNRTAQMKNESIIQSYRRTYRVTSESGGPLLITAEITEYETTTAAKQALERSTRDSSESTREIEEATILDDLNYYHVSSEPDTGSYVSTALYRGEGVMFQAQTIDPNSEYDTQAQTLLAEMIISASSKE